MFSEMFWLCVSVYWGMKQIFSLKNDGEVWFLNEEEESEFIFG